MLSLALSRILFSSTFVPFSSVVLGAASCAMCFYCINFYGRLPLLLLLSCCCCCCFCRGGWCFCFTLRMPQSNKVNWFSQIISILNPVSKSAQAMPLLYRTLPLPPFSLSLSHFVGVAHATILCVPRSCGCCTKSGFIFSHKIVL